MKTIYNTYVVTESQKQCDRMKQLCIDNGLDIHYDFDFFSNYKYFWSNEGEEFSSGNIKAIKHKSPNKNLSNF